MISIQDMIANMNYFYSKDNFISATLIKENIIIDIFQRGLLIHYNSKVDEVEMVDDYIALGIYNSAVKTLVVNDGFLTVETRVNVSNLVLMRFDYLVFETPETLTSEKTMFGRMWFKNMTPQQVTWDTPLNTLGSSFNNIGKKA